MYNSWIWACWIQQNQVLGSYLKLPKPDFELERLVPYIVIDGPN